MDTFRDELNTTQDVLDSRGINADANATMGQWFEGVVALLVLLPLPIAIIDSLLPLVLPEVQAWRSTCANDPAFPPSLYQYLILGQTSSVPADKRLTPALPNEVRGRLDAIQELCLHDASELWSALGSLEATSRNFVAAVYAPGKLAVGKDGRVESKASSPNPWAMQQRQLRVASRAFVAALLDLAHQLREGERAHMLALKPRAVLGGPFEALEALYPGVVAQRQADVARLAR